MIELIAITGLPGTGKTHYAKLLQRELTAVRLSRDEIRAALFEQPAYDDAEKRVCLRLMLTLADYHLNNGHSVILDGMPFSRRAERDAARRCANVANARFKLFYCVCSEEVALARISVHADHLAKDRDAELYHRVKFRFEPIESDEEAIIVDTNSDIFL